VSPELEPILSKCLENDRDLRYQHASEIRADLQRLRRDTDSARVITSAKPAGRTGIAKRWKAIVPTAAAVLALFTAGTFYFHRAPKLTSTDTIVIGDFVNSTGDAVFDDTLRQGLISQLQQSPFLSLVPEERIRATLKLMEQPADARLTAQVTREVCERLGSAAVLDGSLGRVGNRYVLGLRATNCPTGRLLDQQQVQAQKKEDVLDALSQAAANLRSRVGESLATVEKYATPLEVTTRSLEALKVYSSARKLGIASGHLAALPLFKRTVELDPEFASAYAWLGRTYGGLGEQTLAQQNTVKAWQYRDRTSEHERFFIDFSYYRLVKGDLEKAHQICDLWAQAYPRDILPHGFLSGTTSTSLGQFERAEEEGKKALELDPDSSIVYGNLAGSYVLRDRLNNAKIVLQRAAERKLAVPEFLVSRYHIAFLENDKAEMARVAALGYKRSATWCEQEGPVLAYSGHLQQARAMSRRAVDLARQGGRLERAAQHEAGAALREAFFGNAQEARSRARAALALSRGQVVEYGAAFALALAGDSAESTMIADDLAKRFPEDTLVKFSFLPSLRALAALNHREPLKAVEELQRASVYELANQGIAEGFAPSLYPVYVRGLAYLDAHQGANGVVEFQKILDNRGIVTTGPIGALAHLQLGRALVMARDTAKAKTAYQDFLTLWKDADPDIPIFKQAKAEYATLR
jgi:eukaryotic-like serine/threonine-protein kinase